MACGLMCKGTSLRLPSLGTRLTRFHLDHWSPTGVLDYGKIPVVYNGFLSTKKKTNGL